MNNDLPLSWKFEEMVTINCGFSLFGLKTIELSFPQNTTHSLAERSSQQAGMTAWGEKRTLHLLSTVVLMGVMRHKAEVRWNVTE